jgi:O-antigen/teichoic acid export membrane protein
VGFWLIRKDLRWQFDKKLAREVILFGYPFIFAGLAYWIFGSMDRWMLGELSDNTQVGLYSIAFKFATILTFINTAFGQAWSPFAVKIYSENPDYRRIFSQIFSYLFFGLTFVGMLISIFGFEILYLTTPEAYWPAATTLGILAMGIVLSGTPQITALGISLEKKTHLLAAGSWVTAVINFLLNWILIPQWGALGTGIATLISYATLTGYYLYWTQKLHPLPLEVKKLVFSLLVILVTLVFSVYINKFEWNPQIIIFKFLFCGLILYLGFVLEIINIPSLRKPSQRGIA